jgi:hypothetical protein
LNNGQNAKSGFSRVLDLIPATAGIPIFKQVGVTASNHGFATSILTTFLSIACGGTIVFLSSLYLRHWLTGGVKQGSARALLTFVLPIGLAAVLLIASAFVSNKQEVDVLALLIGTDTSVKTYTSSQPATGLAPAAITADEVKKVGIALSDDAMRSARQGCLDNGGSEQLCAELRGDVKSRVVSLGEENIGVVDLTMSLGRRIVAHVVRVMAIRGTELVSVSCARQGTAAPITLESSPCSDEIKKRIQLSAGSPGYNPRDRAQLAEHLKECDIRPGEPYDAKNVTKADKRDVPCNVFDQFDAELTAP